MIGKITLLSPAIKDELHRRFENGEEGDTILPWLNSLPEVQAVLQEKFEGVAISQQNLSEYKRRGFLDWQSRQQALEFAANLDTDDAELRKVLPVDLAGGWQWTQRPDIQAKLFPNRDPDQTRRDVVKMLDRELLGVRPEDQPQETADPAVLI